MIQMKQFNAKITAGVELREFEIETVRRLIHAQNGESRR